MLGNYTFILYETWRSKNTTKAFTINVKKQFCNYFWLM